MGMKQFRDVAFRFMVHFCTSRMRALSAFMNMKKICACAALRAWRKVNVPDLHKALTIHGYIPIALALCTDKINGNHGLLLFSSQYSIRKEVC